MSNAVGMGVGTGGVGGVGTGNVAGSAAAAAWAQSGQVAPGQIAYDPNKFYTRATDAQHGHGEKVSFRIPNSVYAMVNAIVHDDAFPEYQMPSDFMRDAIMHWAYKRADQVNDPGLRDAVKNEVQRVAFADFVALMEREVEHWETLEKSVTTALDALVGARAWEQVRLYLIASRVHADECPEPYRSRIRELVKSWESRIPLEYR